MEVAIRRLGPHSVREVVPTAQGDPKLLEAFDATPNPSAHRPLCPDPNGYWHVCYNHSGRMTWQQEVGTPLVEDDADHLYLNGCNGSNKQLLHEGCGQGHGQGHNRGHGQWRGHISLSCGAALIDC